VDGYSQNLQKTQNELNELKYKLIRAEEDRNKGKKQLEEITEKLDGKVRENGKV
jgi:chromosome segregation ATPase